MAAIETVSGIAKISDSYYEVSLDVVLPADIDDLDNSTITVLSGASLAFGTANTTTFTNVTFIEKQGKTTGVQRFQGANASQFYGCTWYQCQTGSDEFRVSSGCTTRFAAGPDGSPCRWILNAGALQYNKIFGSVVNIESLYIDNMDGGGDIEFSSSGDFSGFQLKDNNPGSTARQVVCLGSGVYTFRGLGARNVAPWFSAVTVNLIDPKGDIPKSGDKNVGVVSIYRTYKATPFDPASGLPLSSKCYLINNDNSNVIVNGFASDVNEELFQQSCPDLQSTFTVVENSYTRGFYKYGYLPTAKTFDVVESLTGSAIDDGDVLMLENSSITGPSKAAVDAYISIDNANQFFDAYCSWLEDNYTAQGSLAIERAIDQINLNALNLDIDAAAAKTFDFDGSKITIKSSNYVGLLTTTGTVTLLNGAVQSGGIIDSNGDSFLQFEAIDSWIVYASAANRDSNTAPLDSGTGSEIYRFTFSGGTTYYLRLTTGTDIIFKDVTPVASGETLVSLGTSALLGNINASIQESSQLAEYDGRVTVDLISGTNSTAYPYGTSKTPTSTIANALIIADDIGVKVIEVRGSSTALPQELNGYKLQSGVTNSTGAKILPTLVLSTLNGSDNCEFEGFLITGATDVSATVDGNIYKNCLIANLSGATGVSRDCKFAGTIQVEYSLDVDDGYGTVIFDMSGVDSTLTVPDFSGSITIINMTSAGASASIGIVSGIVTIDSSCTAGAITVANADQVINNTGGTSVTILQDSGGGLTAQDVWEYNISSITTDGLAGKELLDASGAGSGADVNIISVNGVSVTSIDQFKADVSGIPTNPLLTTDIRLNNLDATISSRLPTDRKSVV